MHAPQETRLPSEKKHKTAGKNDCGEEALPPTRLREQKAEPTASDFHVGEALA